MELGFDIVGGNWYGHFGARVDLALAHDTGASASDRLTNDASVTGTLHVNGNVRSFEIALDNPARRFVDARAYLDADGSFDLDHTVLQSLAGARGLVDGQHTLYVRAMGQDGRSTIAKLGFDLDTHGPQAGFAVLDRGSDTGYAGDGRTETAIIDLTGRAEARSTVSIGGIETIADRNGKFAIDDLHLALGTHGYAMTVTDKAGNTTTSMLTLTRLENSVIHWNDVALQAIQSSSTAPMYATRLLAMESVAMFDVVEALADIRDDGRSPFKGPNQEAAIAQAAHDILMSLYGSDSGPYKGSAALRASFDAALASSLQEIPDGFAEQRGIALGHRIALQILAERAGDGWNAVVDPYSEIGTDPGEWRPTPSGFANPLAPQWGDVQPWSITSSSQFLPPPPPALDSDAYTAAYNETMSVGAANSEALGLRTADQTQIAKFWADGGGTVTPPGHWNHIAAEAASAQGRTTAEIVGLFARLNVAMADAAITCWEAKYTFDYWRPVTAIRLGDSDGNAMTTGDATWTPLIVTPPFPEYTSGHSTFSGAAATILTAEFGASYGFTTGTTSTDPRLAGVTRSFGSFWDAAREAGQSRIYGGIHFQAANQEGLACGEQIGNWVLSRFGV